jgi:hypothetical protein
MHTLTIALYAAAIVFALLDAFAVPARVRWLGLAVAAIAVALAVPHVT